MSSRIELFLHMAEDVGIIRYRGESDESFCIRAAYTGARYWISTFCMDDGSDGTAGLTRQSLNRRLRTWIDGLDNAQPGIKEWFQVDQGKLASVYNRLIDIGEVAQNGFSDRYLAQPPKIFDVCKGYGLLVGLLDPTDRGTKVLGYRRSEIISTGLASLVTIASEGLVERPHWWDSEWDLLTWTRVSDFGDVEYANPATRAWGLRNEEIWSPELQPVRGIALARTNSNDRGGMLYYAVRVVKQKPFLCAIEQAQALELYYHIRNLFGNPVVAKAHCLDDLHVQFDAPFLFIPGEYGRVLEVISWPARSVTDSFKRLTRAECTSLVGELLSKCGVVLKEA